MVRTHSPVVAVPLRLRNEFVRTSFDDGIILHQGCAALKSFSLRAAIWSRSVGAMTGARQRFLLPLVVTLSALGVAVAVETSTGNGGLAFALGFLLIVGLSALALFLIYRVPENAASWVFWGAVLSTILNQTAWTWFANRLPGASAAFVVHNVLLWVSLGLMGFLTLLFPTGQPPTPRWSWVLWLGGLGTLSQVVRPVYLAVDIPLADLADGPTGSSLVDSISLLGQLAVVLAIVAALVGLIIRFIKATGVEKLQMKYVVVPFASLAGFWVVESIWQGSTLAILLLGFGGVTLPLAIVASITRYRLYDIDRIVSRTVTYLVVAALLSFVFAVGVVMIPSLVMGTRSAPPLAVAASTLAVAALFNPLRKLIQASVDRRFNRAKYDAERVMVEFAGSLRDEIDVDEILGGWRSVVTDTMQPAASGVWVRDRR